MIDLIKGQQSFDEQQEETIRRLIGKATQIKGFTDRDVFVQQLEDIVDIFVGANSKLFVDFLADEFKEIIRDQPAIAFSLLTHYGDLLLGSPNAPDDWKEEDIERYEYFSAAAEKLFPEIHLVYQMLHEYAGNNDVDIISELSKEIDDLNEQDSDSFFRYIESRINASYYGGEKNTRVIERICEISYNFVQEYKDRHEMLNFLSSVDSCAPGQSS